MDKSKPIAVIDSGSTDCMSAYQELFEYLIPLAFPKVATLGDDKTKLKVQSYGMMNYITNGHRIL